MARSDGELRHLSRRHLTKLFGAGDIVIANDAATLPASMHGEHLRSGAAIEVRLAGWPEPVDWSLRGRRFVAVVFGSGDYRALTEDRPRPPDMNPGDQLRLGSLDAVVEDRAGHDRLVVLRFEQTPDRVWQSLAHHGRPVQYAHVPEPLALWDVWTSIAVRPVCFEPPSAGFLLTWQLLADWRQRGAIVATLTHAAGLSSTGDATLDRRLPLDEPYAVPVGTAAAVIEGKHSGRRIVAIGTTVARALEAAAVSDGRVKAGNGIARNKIGPSTRLRVVDAMLTGMHAPGESHYELMGAFAGAELLARVSEAAEAAGYSSHEFGDFLLIERQRAVAGTASRLEHLEAVV